MITRPLIRFACAVILFTMTLSLGAGCSSEPSGQDGDSSGPSGQDTPGALLSKWHKALVDADKVPFLECYQGPKEYKDLAGAMFDAYQAVYRLQLALETRFPGQDAWVKVREAKEAGVVSVRPPSRSEAWLKAIHIEIDGNTAIYWHPQVFGDKYMMVCKNGVWRMDLSYKFSETAGMRDIFLVVQQVDTEACDIVKNQDEQLTIAQLAKTMSARFLALKKKIR